MADYRKLKPKILKWEGGFSNHPLDKGGATNKGITIAVFRKYFGLDKTVEDLRRITDGQWDLIFKTGYWDKMKGDQIKNQSIANILVDWAWGSGPITAIKRLQKLLEVRVDGIIGPITLRALNEAKQEDLFKKIWNARRDFFYEIVRRNPSQRVFLRGWMNRLNDYDFEK